MEALPKIVSQTILCLQKIKRKDTNRYFFVSSKLSWLNLQYVKGRKKKKKTDQVSGITTKTSG